MDPVTHALAGATVAWAVSGGRIGRRALAVGAAAALLPDVDVFIRSAADPLLAIEHHRGFTHSLAFVPVGGLLAALPFLIRRSSRERWWVVLASMLAWLSHGLLDAATTYGTQLFWPFSRLRVSLDVISIVDPVFTLFLLAGVIGGFVARRSLVLMSLILCLLWLTLGLVQRERASAIQARVALARGDSVERGGVFPTIGNTLVWRSIYLSGGMLRIDRVRVPWWGQPAYAQVTKVPLASLFPAETTARTARDFARFAWFSDQWVARDQRDAGLIGDARYSLFNSTYQPVWGVRFHPQTDMPTEWVNRSRERRVNPRALWDEITGRDPTLRSLP